MLRLVSSKFSRKITFVEDIAAMRAFFDPRQVQLPNYVIQHNYLSFPIPPIFGAPSLKEVLRIEDNPDGLPRVMIDAMDYLKPHLHVQGLFRQSGEDTLIKELTQRYNRGLAFSLPVSLHH